MNTTRAHTASCTATWCYCYNDDLGDPLCECGQPGWACRCPGTCTRCGVELMGPETGVCTYCLLDDEKEEAL